MEAQVKEYRGLNDSELIKVQHESGAKQKVLTPFYLYLRDRMAAQRLEQRTYLELVASLQEKWQMESFATREHYRAQASTHNARAFQQAPAYDPLRSQSLAAADRDPVVDPYTQGPQRSPGEQVIDKSLNSVKRIFAIVHVPWNDR